MPIHVAKDQERTRALLCQGIAKEGATAPVPAVEAGDRSVDISSVKLASAKAVPTALSTARTQGLFPE